MRFDETVALDRLSLRVPESHIVSVMGPSGCGKSTLLRVIAGLQPPDAGSIWWHDQNLTAVPAHRRGFGLMFQDYALFPHRSVAENVAFGLRMSRWASGDMDARVAEMLETVGLAGYGDRGVDQLSGGEQQRVALARTLAPRPRLIMLDEPLGSLDRTLRDRLVTEMRETFSTLGVTAIYVTHDQDEAFAIGEEVAIMEDGRVSAMGAPAALWAAPGTASVARLIGHDNVLSDQEVERNGIGSVHGNAVAILADAITVVPDPGGAGTIMAKGLRAGRPRTEVSLNGTRLVTAQPTDAAIGERVAVSIETAGIIPLRG